MQLNSKDLNDLCKIATAAAKDAGIYIQSRFDTQLVKRQKNSGDTLASQVVTEVDITAQNIILSHLRPSIKNYDFGILTEELSDDGSRLVKDYFWCIDPLDGTLPFSEGKTGYAVSIALISKVGNPVISVVYIPDLANTYSAVKNGGIKLNDAEFLKKNEADDYKIHVFMDRSFTNESYFDEIINSLQSYALDNNREVTYNDRFGGVLNAISVMNVKCGCYFKFPKQNKGCGSIWDYAATRLFFEELGLLVSNCVGEPLTLNNKKTTFMNEGGILYSTQKELKDFILKMNHMRAI